MNYSHVRYLGTTYDTGTAQPHINHSLFIVLALSLLLCGGMSLLPYLRDDGLYTLYYFRLVLAGDLLLRACCE